MENISKALLIAGGMLIAIIILSMFLIMYNKVTNISKAQEEQKKQEQLSAFNGQYEAYDKQLMYGVDVITLCNKINNNNSSGKNGIISLYYGKDNIETPTIINNIIISKEKEEEAGKTKIVEYGIVRKGDTEVDKVEDFITLRFKCTGIEYNETDGRICKISIVRVVD